MLREIDKTVEKCTYVNVLFNANLFELKYVTAFFAELCFFLTKSLMVDLFLSFTVLWEWLVL